MRVEVQHADVRQKGVAIRVRSRLDFCVHTGVSWKLILSRIKARTHYALLISTPCNLSCKVCP